MKKIQFLHTSQPKLALALINSLHWIECVKFHLKNGWKKELLRKLCNANWFNSWQASTKDLFIHLYKFNLVCV